MKRILLILHTHTYVRVYNIIISLFFTEIKTCAVFKTAGDKYNMSRDDDDTTLKQIDIFNIILVNKAIKHQL